jgi:signal transduction histidine kinase
MVEKRTAMDDRAFSDGQKVIVYFTKMRWLAILFILYVLFHLNVISQFGFPILPCLLLIALGSGLNALYPYLAYFCRGFRDWTFFVYVTGTLDMIFATLLIHYTGGINSPLIVLYYFLLVSGSIFGFIQLDYFLSCQITLIFAAAVLLEAFAVVPHYPLGKFLGASYKDLFFLSAIVASLLLSCLLLTRIASYLANQLREKQKQIEALSNAQADFVSAVMHETKSPLTSIIGYTDILTAGGLGPVADKQQEPLSIIKRQSNRILMMVNDLLSLARLESGRTKLEKKSANLAELVNHVVEEMGPALNAKNLRVVMEADPKTPPVNIDEDKVAEVLTNLVSNAIKFSNDGGRIFVTITPQAKEIMISVRDEGLGIRSVDLPHIFEKFYRASKESSERKGTGLGLALSRLIAKAHGGKLWAVSAGPDQGSVFYFTLPLI